MIAGLIRWSIQNRFLVLVLTVLVTAWGLYSLRQTPVDALPDLSDVQVIIKTSFPGQAPQVVEDQVTYPRLLVLWRFLRLHYHRRWHRSLLGALACPGVPQPGLRQPAGCRYFSPRSGRHRRWLGV